MQPGLYLRLADPENFRSLGYVQMLHVPKNEDFSIDIRHFVKRLPDSTSHFRLLYDVARKFAPICKLPRRERLFFRRVGV